MSINVKVNGININNVIIDDYIYNIKEKLFAYTTGITNWMSFIKITTSSGTVAIDNTKTLSYYIKRGEDQVVIDVNNIFEEIEQKYSITELDLVEHKSIIDELYQIGYTLTEDELIFIIKVIKLNKYKEVRNNDDVTQFVNNILSKRKKILEKYDKMNQFYTLANEITDYSDYYETTTNSEKKPLVRYSYVDIRVTGKSIKYGVRGRFINI